MGCFCIFFYPPQNMAWNGWHLFVLAGNVSFLINAKLMLFMFVSGISDQNVKEGAWLSNPKWFLLVSFLQLCFFCFIVFSFSGVAELYTKECWPCLYRACQWRKVSQNSHSAVAFRNFRELKWLETLFYNFTSAVFCLFVCVTISLSFTSINLYSLTVLLSSNTE